MREIRRLLGFVGPYWWAILLSAIMMAAVGAATAMTALLVGKVFSRVLNPTAPDAPVDLFKIPVFNYTVYLDRIMPGSIHNVWTLVALAILFTFLTKGVCDYAGNFLVNYAGLSAVTDLRQNMASLKHVTDNMTTVTEDFKVMSGSIREIGKSVKQVGTSVQKVSALVEDMSASASTTMCGVRAGVKAGFGALLKGLLK